MCWAYRTTATDVVAASNDVVEPHLGRIATAGRDAAVLVSRGGALRWMATRYGMSLPTAGRGSQLIWNARDDKLDTVETWARLIRQRFAVPIDAYVETAPAETWHVGPEAWMVGLYDATPNGGAVAITEDGRGTRIPVLVDRRGALAWLAAQQWDAVSGLRAATRIGFAEADLFSAKALSADARTRVPLARAA